MAHIQRGLATSAAKTSQLVKTPIQVHGVEGKYAAALYSAAHKQNKLDQVEKDLGNVRNIFQENKKFKVSSIIQIDVVFSIEYNLIMLFWDFILDPTMKATKKRSVVEEVSTKMGLSKETGNFLGLLAENRRLNKFEAVVASFESIMRAHRGELFVQVTSAEDLSTSNQKALTDALSKVAKSGQKVTVTYNVKPQILGGLVVTIDDKYVDMSIASRVKKYKDALATAI